MAEPHFTVPIFISNNNSAKIKLFVCPTSSIGCDERHLKHLCWDIWKQIENATLETQTYDYFRSGRRPHRILRESSRVGTAIFVCGSVTRYF